MIDGGNEWYENSIRRAKELEPKGIKYIAMGVSGGEEGAVRVWARANRKLLIQFNGKLN